eukprot:6995213-Prymnesium_polylepis.1
MVMVRQSKYRMRRGRGRGRRRGHGVKKRVPRCFDFNGAGRDRPALPAMTCDSPFPGASEPLPLSAGLPLKS